MMKKPNYFVLCMLLVGYGSGLVNLTNAFAQGHGWDDDFNDEASQAAFAARDYQYCSVNGQNELGLGNCLNSQAKYSENELNSTYQEIINKLTSEKKEILRKGERKWIKWRIKECARQAKEVEDCVNGCGVPWTMEVICMTKEANNRTDYLKNKWAQ